MAAGARKEEIVGSPGSRVNLRPAIHSDCYTILKWRNNPLTVKNSLTGRKIDLQAHEAWFAKAMPDPNTEIFIANTTEDDVGMIRFDRGGGDIATVSIMVAPGWRGLGIGRRILEQGCLMKKDWVLSALIKNTNKASISIFEGCGFCLVSEGEDGFRAYVRGKLLL